MLWILLALACPLLHGVANLIDNYLTDKVFKRVSTLVFYSAFFNIAFLPFVLLVGWPGLPELRHLPHLLIIGLIDVLYLYPYFFALKNDDTSVVISLFSLGKVIVPVLAFLTVGETLTLLQYAGFIVILLSSSLLTMKSSKILHWNKSFYYMFLASLLLSIQAVLFKYIFNESNWVNGFFWSVVFSFIWAMLLLISPKERQGVRNEFEGFKRIASIFAIEEFFTFSGTAAGTYALAIAPATLVKSIEEFQPFFVLSYALLLKRFFPRYFREQIDRKSTLKKIILFGGMTIGIFLILN